MIILDLEWNRGYDKTPLNEILQIGAVRTQDLGGPITDTFNAYIRPAVHKRFDRGAKSLPELQTSRQSELNFVTAMERFRAWCGDEDEFALWGADDLAALEQNCAHWGLPALTTAKVYNFQQALAFLLGTDQQIALWRAVNYLNIPDSFTFHNALNDALYTALVGRWLTPESLAYRPEPHTKTSRRRVTLKLSGLPFDPLPGQDFGPVPSPELILNDRTVRHPPCPVCGQKGSITQWRLAQLQGNGTERQCFSIFSCSQHGRFLCRLTLSRLDSGLWEGWRAVPAVTPELTGAYTTAFQQGGVHQCRARRKKSRRRKKAGHRL